MRRSAIIAATCLLAACGDEGKRPLGATCSDDSQCLSGLCLESRCLDPDADDDLDGLTNRIEAGLGTSPSNSDSDGDGMADGDEVGMVAAPRDFDEDGRNDAVESATLDSDGDCLVDERDPEDDDPKLDAARLADLGCCCDGRCSLRGAAPTATCVDGVLRCEGAGGEADRDGDGIADPCDTARLTLAGEVVAAGCQDACERLAECPDGPPMTPEACRAECLARGPHEGLWLANYYCLAASCDAGACFGAGQDFDIPGQCTDACAHAAACGTLALEPVAALAGACEVGCAGVDHALGDLSGTPFACYAALPSEGCRPVDALPCALGTAICLDACAKVGARPDGDQPVCPAGAPAYTRYPTPATCAEACLALGGFGQVAFLGCSITRACSDDEGACVSARDPAPSGCSEACAAFADKCPAHALSNPSICRAFCSGVAAAIPDPSLDTALACIEALPACPPNESSALAALLGCISGIDDRCKDACARLVECNVGATGGDVEGCERACTNLVLAHPERIEPTFACVARDPTCDELARCLPADVVQVCSPACMRRLRCEPDYPGGLSACEAACAADLQGDVERITGWMCEAVTTSCDVACDSLMATAPPAVCATACAEAADTCIEAAYGICPRACQGALGGIGAGANQDAARCVVKGLGRRCEPTGPTSCVVP